MKETLKKIKEQALSAIADDNCDLEALRIQYLGKKGELTAVLRGMGQLTPEERPVIGQLANEVREEIETAMKEKQAELKAKALEKALVAEKLDVTMPAKVPVRGHPSSVGAHPRTLQTALSRQHPDCLISARVPCLMPTAASTSADFN